MSDEQGRQRPEESEAAGPQWWTRDAGADPWSAPAGARQDDVSGRSAAPGVTTGGATGATTGGTQDVPPVAAPPGGDPYAVPPSGSQPGYVPGRYGEPTMAIPSWYPSTASARPQEPRGPRTTLLLALALLVALVAGGVGGAIGAATTRSGRGSTFDATASLPAPAAGSTARPAGSVAGIAARTLPSVVSISVRTDTGGGTGSGFVLRTDGYLLTNNHVVSEAVSGGGSIDVTFPDQRSFPARIVGTDASYDLAVLKIAATNLPVALLGNSDGVVVGDEVVAIGAPLGLAGTVTSGIISALNRPVTAGDSTTGGDESFISALQTDAAINPGNSGGPLVDASGRVIGVNSAIATLGGGGGLGSGQTGSIGLGFAIPINQARFVAEQLIRSGKAVHPIMGVSLDATFTGDGARIATRSVGGQQPIAPGGPADKAGLRPGDVITAINGMRVAGNDELIVAIRAHLPGDTVTVTYQRAGQRRTTKVTLGSSAAD